MYMSPEQINGEKIDKLTDIYSLGVTLFYMAVGKPPYENSNAIKMGVQILTEDFPKAKEIYPGVSNKIETIIKKATQKNKIDRYQSCIEFRKDLNSSPAKINGGKVVEIKDEKTKNKSSFTSIILFSILFFMIIVFGWFYFFMNSENIANEEVADELIVEEVADELIIEEAPDEVIVKEEQAKARITKEKEERNERAKEKLVTAEKKEEKERKTRERKIKENLVRLKDDKSIYLGNSEGVHRMYLEDEIFMGDIFAGDGLIYLRSTLEPLNGCYITNTSLGNIKFCCLNGKSVSFLGEAEWHNNGQLKYKVDFIGDNILRTTGWYESGELYCKIYENINGWRTGSCSWYYKNGNLKTEQIWEPNIYEPETRNGLWKDYHENGQLSSYVRYKNGKKNGVYKKFYINGQLEKEIIYKDGEVLEHSFGNKFEECWDMDGNKIDCK